MDVISGGRTGSTGPSGICPTDCPTLDYCTCWFECPLECALDYYSPYEYPDCPPVNSPAGNPKWWLEPPPLGSCWSSSPQGAWDAGA